MPRALAGLAVTVCALAACATSTPQTVRADQAADQDQAATEVALFPPDQRDQGDHLVVLFGDSLSELAAPVTLGFSIADPDLRLSAQFYGGTEFDTRTWMRAYDLIEEGSIVLLLLGTNDVYMDTVEQAQADAAAAIDRVTAAGASRVVVATVSSRGGPPELGPLWQAKAHAFNDWLRRADADPGRFPTLRVADWDLASRDRADWIRPDGIHTTAAGQVAYAALVYEATRAALDSLTE